MTLAGALVLALLLATAAHLGLLVVMSGIEVLAVWLGGPP